MMKRLLLCSLFAVLSYAHALATPQLTSELPVPSRRGVATMTPPAASSRTFTSQLPVTIATSCLDGTAIECQNLEELVANNYVPFYGTPPDPVCAVGPTHVINVTNVLIQWRPKDNAQDAPEFEQPLAYFFGLVATPTDYAYTFDPKVIYDQYADRFVLVLMAGETVQASTWLVAVSKTSDPNDGWWLHSFPGSATVGSVTYYIDYPGVAVDDEALYLTANLWDVTLTTYYGPYLWIVRKTPGAYDTDVFLISYPYDLKALGLSTRTTQPAHTYGSMPLGYLGRPFGTFLVTYNGLSSAGDERIKVISVTDPLSSAGGIVFDGQLVDCGDIDNTAVAIPNAPQAGGPELISTHGRAVYNAVWRDNSLYLAANCVPPSGPDAGQATAHWWRVGTTFDGFNQPVLAMADQGNIGGEDLGAGTYTFMPNVMVDSAGDLAVGFCASGPSIYAGAYFASRMAADAPGTIGATCALAPGVDYYYRVNLPDTRNRWGDYTGLALCPVDETTFWVYNQYAGPSGHLDELGSMGDGIWNTKLGKFQVGKPVSVAITAFDAGVSDGAVTLRGAFSSTLGVETVNVYRGTSAGAFARIESIAQNGSGFAYVDHDVTPGATYRYRIGVIDADGEYFSRVATVTLDEATTALAQNNPNPFNPVTVIPYSLAESGEMTLAIYDATGQIVRRLVSGAQNAGRYTATWYGRDDRGVPVASGVYFCRLHTREVTETRRMVLLK